jgi:hypothetical protein
MTNIDKSGTGKEEQSISTHRVRQHLSVDTRLAARAILDEHSIGRTSTQTEAKVPPGFIEWLQRVQLKLSVIVFLFAGILTLVPIWSEVNSRTYATNLQTALVVEARALSKGAGQKQIAQWMESNNVEAMRKYYLDRRPVLLASLAKKGFTISERNLSVRLDYEHKLMLLGVTVVERSGRHMTWASPTDEVVMRALPKASLQIVFSENRDMIALMGVILGLCLAFVWVAPIAYRTRSRD